ncbi:MAG: DMT family transporter [Anaerolineae bacterium]|nr:DMT family transporter [Anaerolineae bacterium]
MASVSALIQQRLNPNVNWRPYAALAAGIFVGSIGVIFIRQAQREVPTIAIVTLRLLLTITILTPVVLRSYRDQIRKLTRAELLLTAVAGVMFGMGLITGFEALNHTSVLISGVLGASVPLWVALLERSVLKTRLHRNVWLGIVLALGGSALISFSLLGGGAGMGAHPLLGGGLALVSAFVTAVYFIIGRSVRPHVSLAPFLWLLCLFAAFTTLAVTFATRTTLTGYSLESYFWILLITLGPQLIVQSSYSYVLAYFSATSLGIMSQLVTVGNAAVALIVFHEVPLPVQLLGSAIILAGVALANLRSSQA